MARRFLALVGTGMVASFAATWAFVPIGATDREGAATQPPPAQTNVYYPYCRDARAAGAAPLYRGQPGYRPELDADGDGIACEPYYGQSDGEGRRAQGVRLRRARY